MTAAAAATNVNVAKPTPKTVTTDVHAKPAAKAIDEPRESKRVDRFDVKGVGAPSPDVSGMIDDDAMELDPATQLPTIPAHTLSPRKA